MSDEQKTREDMRKVVERWEDTDPAHRGAVLMTLWNEARAYGKDHDLAQDLPDVAAQVARRKALSRAFQDAAAVLTMSSGHLLVFEDVDGTEVP